MRNQKSRVFKHPKSGCYWVPSQVFWPTVLTGCSMETEKNDGSKPDHWGHVDLGSKTTFTACVTIGELLMVSRPHWLPLQNEFCIPHLVSLWELRKIILQSPLQPVRFVVSSRQMKVTEQIWLFFQNLHKQKFFLHFFLFHKLNFDCGYVLGSHLRHFSLGSCHFPMRL